MSLFDHDDPDDFLLFIWNFQMTLVATGTLVALSHKVQSKQKAKHDSIVHILRGFSLVYRLKKFTHNYTIQVVSTILLLNHRAYDTLQSNCLARR